MEERVSEAKNSPKHRDKKDSKFVNYVAAGVALALAAGNTAFAAFEYRDELRDKTEYRDVYPAVDDYLYYQGYTDRVKLRISISDNSFSFISLSSASGPEICAGSYKLTKEHAVTVGEIACAVLDHPEELEPGTTTV